MLPTFSRLLAIFVAFGALTVAATAAQRLPGGTVPEPKKETLKRPVKTKLSRRPTSALLIVVTAPNAEIALDGRPIGNADAEGQFEKEVPAGTYTLRVSAGSGYSPGEVSVALKPRQREIVSVELVSRFGSVVLGLPSLASASILVDATPVARFDKDGRVLSLTNAEVDLERLTVTLKLEEGVHTIRFEASDLSPVEESLTVRGGQTQAIAIRSEPMLAGVEIVSDPDTMVLLDGAQWGRTGPDGLFSGRASAGEHTVRLERRGYEPFEQRRLFGAGDRVRIEQRLPPTVTRVSFGDDFEFGLGRWDHPATGWSVTDGALVVGGAAEPGLARGIRYSDFVLSFNLTLVTPGGAAWLVRAQDARNYYLFYLSGPAGRYPNRLAVYVVRDGQFDPDRPVSPPVPVASKLEAGGNYYLEVTARENRITTRITPLATGVPESLGEFADPQRLYLAGGIGFRSVQGERFEVDNAYADPPGESVAAPEGP